MRSLIAASVVSVLTTLTFASSAFAQDNTTDADWFQQAPAKQPGAPAQVVTPKPGPDRRRGAGEPADRDRGDVLARQPHRRRRQRGAPRRRSHLPRAREARRD